MSKLCEELAEIFNATFKAIENTMLIATDDEPHYQPQSNSVTFDRIFYTRDSYTSLMHEVAHWCRAGQERRRLVDYGYWYKAQDRSAEEQKLYVQSESKTQALEWIFCRAAGLRLAIIPDNQPHSFEPSLALRQGIQQAVLSYLKKGLPPRAERFTQMLLKHYQQFDSC